MPTLFVHIRQPWMQRKVLKGRRVKQLAKLEKQLGVAEGGRSSDGGDSSPDKTFDH
jgi:hypothetical protein